MLPDAVVHSQYNQKFTSCSAHPDELLMELSAAIKLIGKGVLNHSKPQVWADLGAGKGLFSSALSTLLSSGSMIYAVDQDKKALSSIKVNSTEVSLKTIHGNFTTLQLETGPLDGILMANSLHFVSDKIGLLQNLKRQLGSAGRFIIVEYDMRTPNRWVPYPISFEELKTFAEALNLSITKIGERPSVYNSSNIYSSVLEKQKA